MLDTAAVLGALGTILVLVAQRREILVPGFALLAAAEVLLAHAGGLSLSAGLVGAGFFGLLLAAIGAALLLRAPWLVLPLLVVAAPFRLPIDFGREHRFYVAIAHGGQLGRLLPLYAVLSVCVLAFLWELVRGQPVKPIPRELAWPAAAFLALTSLSLLWSSETESGRTLLEFFLLPFACLVAVAGRAAFPARMPRILVYVAVTLASIFAVVGIIEAATHRLIFYSHNLQVANTYSSFFRVTSLFRDPNLYGRHVVLGIVVLVVCLLLRKVEIPLGGPDAVMWVGLYFSYSQSSYAALFVAVFAVNDRDGGRAHSLGGACRRGLVALVAAGIAAPKVADTSVRKATSDRSRRIELTAKVFEHHPVVGVGIGGQPIESQRLADRPASRQAFVSHTTPLTVAAELGTVGVLLYLALLAGSAATLWAVWRRHRTLGLSLAAVFLALFVHALAYSGFFEDPMTWLVLAVASAVPSATSPSPQR